MDNIEIARRALQLMLDRTHYGRSAPDTQATEKIIRDGLDALDTVEAEMRLLRDAHRGAMKALMHRLGDPG